MQITYKVAKFFWLSRPTGKLEIGHEMFPENWLWESCTMVKAKGKTVGMDPLNRFSLKSLQLRGMGNFVKIVPFHNFGTFNGLDNTV